MNKEFLHDYERKEIELQKEYYRNIKASEITMVKGYPPLSRFKKYNDPLVICDEKAYIQYGERIWSQIPFAGTLIIPLGVSNKENFLRLHGFDINEIPELVKLSRETGRVKFTLNTNPTHYEGMDYLEPIFSELEPLMLTMPSNIYTSDENYGRFIMEKVTLHPQTSQVCINVIEHYKQNELYKLLNSLQQAVYARNKEMLFVNLRDLNEILDNIWKDAKK